MMSLFLAMFGLSCVVTMFVTHAGKGMEQVLYKLLFGLAGLFCLACAFKLESLNM